VSRRREATTTRGFTLIEAIMAMAVTAVLLTGMAVALRMTISATDMGDDGNARAASASAATFQISAEMSSATAVSAFTPNDILLTLPDRNADGSPETVEYTWSGTPGDPIKRAYNGSTPTAFINSVQSVATSLVDRPAAQPVDSAEQTFVSCDTPTGGTLTDYTPLDITHWVAQYYRPVLPAGAVKWSITRVRLCLYQSGTSSDSFAVEIRTADSGLRPTGTILASVPFQKSILPGYATWTEFAIGPVSGLGVNQGVCIVVRGTGSTTRWITAQYVSGSSAQPYNSHMVTSSNAGLTWSTPGDANDLRFVLLGTYTTMVEP